MKVKERPIIFSSSMIQAILGGYKTQARRVVKSWHCPYGGSGDRLWVRETFAPMQDIEDCTKHGEPVDIVYRADDGWIDNEPESRELLMEGKWRPSIFMPKWASRILLEIIGVRTEKLQSISISDVIAEGIQTTDGEECGAHPYEGIERFQALWDGINAKRGFAWHLNPWVWVVEFKVLQPS